MYFLFQLVEVETSFILICNGYFHRQAEKHVVRARQRELNLKVFGLC